MIRAAWPVILLFAFALPAMGAPAGDQQNADAVWKAVRASAKRGPDKIALNNQASLQLPAGYAFVPHDAAAKLLALWGNQSGDDLLGLILPTDGSDWFVDVEYIQSGYIKDGDAKNWDSGHLLENLKDGTEQDNDFRKKQGIPPIEVVGWVQAPRYDSVRHRLVWSAQIREKGKPSTDKDGVNYNTYVLGRHGYISMNMVTDLASVNDDKPVAQALLDDVNFLKGKRYQDFDGSTDKVAAYGLAALVGGLAAKKLGLLAVMGAFFLKAWKLIAVAAVAFGARFRKFFKRS